MSRSKETSAQPRRDLGALAFPQALSLRSFHATYLPIYIYPHLCVGTYVRHFDVSINRSPCHAPLHFTAGGYFGAMESPLIVHYPEASAKSAVKPFGRWAEPDSTTGCHACVGGGSASFAALEQRPRSRLSQRPRSRRPRRYHSHRHFRCHCLRPQTPSPRHCRSRRRSSCSCLPTLFSTSAGNTCRLLWPPRCP